MWGSGWGKAEDEDKYCCIHVAESRVKVRVRVRVRGLELEVRIWDRVVVRLRLA